MTTEVNTTAYVKQGRNIKRTTLSRKLESNWHVLHEIKAVEYKDKTSIDIKKYKGDNAYIDSVVNKTSTKLSKDGYELNITTTDLMQAVNMPSGLDLKKIALPTFVQSYSRQATNISRTDLQTMTFDQILSKNNIAGLTNLFADINVDELVCQVENDMVRVTDVVIPNLYFNSRRAFLLTIGSNYADYGIVADCGTHVTTVKQLKNEYADRLANGAEGITCISTNPSADGSAKVVRPKLTKSYDCSSATFDLSGAKLFLSLVCHQEDNTRFKCRLDGTPDMLMYYYNQLKNGGKVLVEYSKYTSKNLPFAPKFKDLIHETTVPA